MGVSNERDYELYKMFKNGDIDYTEWLTLLESEYKSNTPKETVVNVLSTYTLADGAGGAARIAKAHGLTTAIISGSFTITAEKLAADLGIDYVRANTACKFTNNNTNVAQYFDRLVSGGEEGAAKLLLLEQLCDELGFELTEVIAVGDSMNDVKIFEATGCGVTFEHVAAEVKAASTHTIQSLTEFPKLLETILESAQS